MISGILKIQFIRYLRPGNAGDIMIEQNTQLNKAINEMWRVGIYCRLSKDDELEGESASVSNQRDLLVSYCKTQEWNVIKIFQDDGYSGLNQNRPGLQALLASVEKGEINLVITKDLSRLGRNYVDTGNLMDDFFPKHNVRYIAVNDNIDSIRDANDIAPFKNILNEFYSRDIGKKVHSTYLLHGKQGLFTGVVPPLGYVKDPENKGHLIVDEDTSWIIKKIFDYALDGRGSNYIRRRLEEDKVPCPCYWLREKGYRNHYTKWERKDPENGRFIWDFTVIEKILQNPVYTGAICSQKFEYRFKSGITRKKGSNEWLTVEGMHEPIISKDDFDTVQRKIKSRKCPRKGADNYSLFAGLIKCGDCGKSLTIKYTHAVHPIMIYSCASYNKMGKNYCTQHRVEYDMLYNMVLEQIRDIAKEALADSRAVAEKLMKQSETSSENEIRRMKKQSKKDAERCTFLDRLIAKLYEDQISGRISDVTFNTMIEKYQTEQNKIRERLASELPEIELSVKQRESIEDWVELVKKYADVRKLDSRMLNRLIRDITVFEKIDKDGNRNIRIEMHYNFSRN